MDWQQITKLARWPMRFLAAIRDLPTMRADIQALKARGGDPLRCTACGQRLKVTAIRDVEAHLGGALWGEELDLRCDTPGCAFTPRKRQVPFRQD